MPTSSCGADCATVECKTNNSIADRRQKFKWEGLVNLRFFARSLAVSALAGRENVLHAYNVAVQERYRFFSFGDAMFIH